MAQEASQFEGLPPELQRQYASELRKQQTGPRASQGLRLGSQALSMTKYKNKRLQRGLGSAATAAKAFEQGRGVKGAAKDVALEELKRQAFSAALKQIGLSSAFSTINTVSDARKLANELDRRARDHREMVYLFMLLVALVKDFADLATLEVLSGFDWILDWFIWGLLYFFLWGKGRWKVKLVIFVAAFFEMIPGTGAIPSWTICVLYAYHMAVQKAVVHAILRKLLFSKTQRQIKESVDELKAAQQHI